MLHLKQCPSCHKPLRSNPLYSNHVSMWCAQHGDFFIYRERGKEPRIIYRPFKGPQRIYKKRPSKIVPRSTLLTEMGIPKPQPRVGVGRPGYPLRCDQTGVVYQTMMKAAADLNLHQSDISKHLRGRRKHVNGYTFTRLKDDGLGNVIDIPRPTRAIGAERRRIAIRCDQTGEEFSSIADAGRAMNLSRGTIAAVVQGTWHRKSVGGYTFSRI